MKHCLILITTLAAVFTLSAQDEIVYYNGNKPDSQSNFEIMPFYGYMPSGLVQLHQGKIKLKGNNNYGLAVALPIESNRAIELSYFRMNSEANWHPYPNTTTSQSGNYNITVQNIQIGGRISSPTGRIRPIATVSIGATWFENKFDNHNNYFGGFTGALSIGVSIEINKYMALCFQARVMVPTYFYNDNSFQDPNNPYEHSTPVYAIMTDFTTGLRFKILQTKYVIKNKEF